MSDTQYPPQEDGEVFRPTFPTVSEAERPYTMLSYGLPFDDACRKNLDGYVNVTRAYIICSKSIATQSNNLQKLEAALRHKHAGTWVGAPVHSLYNGLIPILLDINEKQADCVITLGSGNLADGAKLIVHAIENGVDTVEDLIALEKSFIVTTDDVLTGTRIIGKSAKISLTSKKMTAMLATR